MQMMAPLLFAYEERIAELEAVIERSVSLAEQAQLLAKENDQLRAELHERTEQLRNAQVLSGSQGEVQTLNAKEQQALPPMPGIYILYILRVVNIVGQVIRRIYIIY